MQRLRRLLSRSVHAAYREKLFVASLAGLGITTALRRGIPQYTLGDFYIISTLLALLIVVKGLEDSGLLKYVAARIRSYRRAPQYFILLTAVISVLATNDMAVITVVPLTIAANLDRAALLVALETIVANGASSLSPIGSPQNIFIYLHYHLAPLQFIGAIWPLSVAIVAMALLLSLLVPPPVFSPQQLASPDWPRAYASALFLLVIFLILIHLLPPIVLAGPVIYAILADRRSLKIDWCLLGTFLALFGFTDNLVHIFGVPAHRPVHIFLSAVAASQVISNVPAALLLSDFTTRWRALLWGVSVGGFGSLIGSMASLIAFRLYVRRANNQRRFLLILHVLNIAALFLGVALYALVYRAIP